jgi:hypothetical protein
MTSPFPLALRDDFKNGLPPLMKAFQQDPRLATGYILLPCSEHGGTYYFPSYESDAIELEVPSITTIIDPIVLYALLTFGLDPNRKIILTLRDSSYIELRAALRLKVSAVLALRVKEEEASLLSYFLMLEDDYSFHLLRFGGLAHSDYIVKVFLEGRIDLLMMIFKSKQTVGKKGLETILQGLGGDSFSGRRSASQDKSKGSYPLSLRYLLLNVDSGLIPDKLPASMPLWSKKLLGNDALPKVNMRYQDLSYQVEFNYYQGRGFFLAMITYYEGLVGEYSIL